MLSARVEAPGGLVATVRPGDLIGRSFRSALRIDDPRISEAHAMVSLRGGRLKLLALRGALAVDTRRVNGVELNEGLTVRLAEDVSLHVLEVTVPRRLLAVRVADGPAVALMGSVQSLLGDPPAWVSGYREQALASVWSTGESWMLRAGTDDPVAIDASSEFTFRDTAVAFDEIEIESASAPSTIDAGRLHPPLHLVVRFHSAHIHRRGHPVLSLAGLPARLMSELVVLDGPTDWFVVSRQLWRRHTRRELLRKKLDNTLLRLRQKLAKAGVRDDLVRADGTGRLEVVLYDDDRVEDLT